MAAGAETSEIASSLHGFCLSWDVWTGWGLAGAFPVSLLFHSMWPLQCVAEWLRDLSESISRGQAQSRLYPKGIIIGQSGSLVAIRMSFILRVFLTEPRRYAYTHTRSYTHSWKHAPSGN